MNGYTPGASKTKKLDVVAYDYDLQVWLINGIIQNCKHPESMKDECEILCNGRKFAGVHRSEVHL